jgi:hypothetical protein
MRSDGSMSDGTDIIILDLALPRLDGRDVLAELKSLPKARNIPIVVVTGTDAEDLRDAACIIKKPTTSDNGPRRSRIVCGNAEADVTPRIRVAARACFLYVNRRIRFVAPRLIASCDARTPGRSQIKSAPRPALRMRPLIPFLPCAKFLENPDHLVWLCSPFGSVAWSRCHAELDTNVLSKLPASTGNPRRQQSKRDDRFMSAMRPYVVN